MSGGVTTDFLLDGSEIAEEIAGEGVTSYVGPGLISEVSGTARSVYHADGLGSTRTMSGSSQVITEAGIYDAYGNLAQDFPASSSPSFGYAGQHRYCTDATGLDYLKARYYDPEIGRFLSRDPIGYLSGLNVYAYAQNNPILNVDPTGKFVQGCLLIPWCRGLVTCLVAAGFRFAWEIGRDIVVGKPINWGNAGCKALCQCITSGLGAAIPKTTLGLLIGVTGGTVMGAQACSCMCDSIYPE